LEANKNIGHKRAQRDSIFGRLLSRQSMPQLLMCDFSFWVVAAFQQRGSKPQPLSGWLISSCATKGVGG
jgi:hypothetical protein